MLRMIKKRRPIMHRIILTLFMLISLVLPSTAAAADLDTMIGQMLMAGFRGFEAPADSPIIRDIENTTSAASYCLITM